MALSRVSNWVSRKRRSLLRKKKSAVFLHGSYYNFFYLAQELRRRGWDAVTVNVDSPDHPAAKLRHGEDINLYSADSKTYQKRIQSFFGKVRRHFSVVHFYGIGRMSFFPQYWDRAQLRSDIPWDFLELKRAGVKIGYTHCGCMDMVSQTTFNRWSKGVWQKCVWQLRPDVCGDLINLSWGAKVQTFCDVICSEGEPLLDFKSGPKVVREPMTFAISPEVWSQSLSVPERLKQVRQEGETLVYHGVANVNLRQQASRNIKGTPALLRAIDNLSSQGHKIRLVFVNDLPSVDVRFVQAQCDILVDQLNYGRFGATAREGLMLGKPTVSWLTEFELDGERAPQCVVEAPIVRANESDVEGVLRSLVSDSKRRREIGGLSREYAIKWWSPEACADRFEEVYDRVCRGFEASDARFGFETRLRPEPSC